MSIEHLSNIGSNNGLGVFDSMQQHFNPPIMGIGFIANIAASMQGFASKIGLENLATLPPIPSTPLSSNIPSLFSSKGR